MCPFRTIARFGWPVEEYVRKIGKEGAIPGFRESMDSTLYLDHVGIFNKEEFTLHGRIMVLTVYMTCPTPIKSRS